jgi:hypothetical protein
VIKNCSSISVAHPHRLKLFDEMRVKGYFIERSRALCTMRFLILLRATPPACKTLGESCASCGCWWLHRTPDKDTQTTASKGSKLQHIVSLTS